MCKSGKSLLRWLTFKHAHQSPGHLTHLWDQVWLAENLRVSSSVSRWWCPCLDPLTTFHKTPCDVLSVFSCVQLCAGCDCLSVSAGHVKLLQEEGNSVVTPSSELHTWLALELPPIMILTGHNLPPIEKLSQNVLQLKKERSYRKL